jgi:sugar/nucleoside kinase (ribokinase family)
MDSQLIDWLRIQPTQLIVNMQSNAANRGFNTVSRYKGVHSVFLNGGEVLLEARSKETDLGTLIPELGIALGIEEFYVTNGSRGIFAWTRNGGLYESPALAPLVIDRVGAGDATLAAVSAMRAVNIPIDICLFFGNIAGAILVGSIGNEISISADRLKKEADLILSKAESGI